MLYMSCDAQLKEDILSTCGNDEDERLGVEIMFRSLPAPIKQIAKNAGFEGEVIAEKCRNKPFGFGYNAATDTFEDLLATGVLDPAKVRTLFFDMLFTNKALNVVKANNVLC